ncbi:helix-turn-helix domain-containing protein [Streptomyces sp. NPDC002795]|uniref:helix-turn-helix domain-containing protein n=1 Tax=Streptomyces sp. NPDC002795 TaxID=3364665 RepID=UPI0036ACC857
MSLTDAQRAVLEGWVRRRSTAQALRSRIVLECAEGHSIREVSRRLTVAPDTVRTWRRRFLDRGLDGFSDEPRPGVPRKISDADVEAGDRPRGRPTSRRPDRGRGRAGSPQGRRGRRRPALHNWIGAGPGEGDLPD